MNTLIRSRSLACLVAVLAATGTLSASGPATAEQTAPVVAETVASGEQAGLLPVLRPGARATTRPLARASHPVRRVSPALLDVRGRAAWKWTKGEGIVVAVIDGGVAPHNPNLRGQVLDGVDMVNPNRPHGWHDPIAFGGHGTGVASIIAGTGRGNGVLGVAPAAAILPVRVANARGFSPDGRIGRGIDWAVKHGADVINISMGGRHPDRRTRRAARRAVRRGVVVVAGGGNDGPRNERILYPAAYAPVIAVAGTATGKRKVAGLSSRGEGLDVAAPCTMVWNTNSDGTRGRASGTSFATPMVSGAVALMLAVNPRLSPARVAAILRRTATDLGEPGRDEETGAGRLHVRAAVATARRAR